MTCERGDLEDHMKICDKEELECCFSHAGCQGRFLREDEERHMEENTKKHLSLMATTMLKIQDKLEQQKVEFQKRLQEEEVKHREQEVKLQELLHEKLQEQEKKLQKQEVKFQEDLQGKEDELERIRKEMEKKVRQTEMKFQRALEEHGRDEAAKLKDIKNEVAELQYNTGHVYIFPVTITMPLYEQLKAENGRWYSQVLYTNLGGYSFRIAFFPNGHPNVDDRGTHVSVCYKPIVGNYDAQLKWPVTVTVSIQLLNQHADKDHVTREISWKYNKKDTTGTTIWIYDKFISHKKLDWNAEKETQYLKNNCLQFKVVKVEVRD